MDGEWIDVSIPLRSNMVHWPGDPEVSIERVLDIERGDSATVSAISMGAHTGTHMDSPLHYLQGGMGLDELPLDVTLGPARVIEIQDPESIKPGELDVHDIQPGERVLFKTRNSGRCWDREDFVEDFVYISREGAEYLASRRIKLAGVDYLSVGPFRGDGPGIHRALLGAGIWIVEGLDLSQVSAGPYELICLPLKISGGDGGPARAILRPSPPPQPSPVKGEGVSVSPPPRAGEG
jgi:arylformamidase